MTSQFVFKNAVITVMETMTGFSGDMGPGAEEIKSGIYMVLRLFWLSVTLRLSCHLALDRSIVKPFLSSLK